MDYLLILIIPYLLYGFYLTWINIPRDGFWLLRTVLLYIVWSFCWGVIVILDYLIDGGRSFKHGWRWF